MTCGTCTVDLLLNRKWTQRQKSSKSQAGKITLRWRWGYVAAPTYDVRQHHFERRPVPQHPLQLQTRPAHVEALLLCSYCHLQHTSTVTVQRLLCGATQCTAANGFCPPLHCGLHSRGTGFETWPQERLLSRTYSVAPAKCFSLESTETRFLSYIFQFIFSAGPSGHAAWGVGLDCLDKETVGSNPA
jgi:hypothetical protein